jgi:DNA-binding NarL/FixJ family response regulator
MGFPEGNRPTPSGDVVGTLREDRDGHGEGRASAVVIDAYPLWLDAVEAVLRGLGLPTLGKATSPAEGLALIVEHRPDIVVTDIDFGPGQIGGTSYLRDVIEARTDVKVIVLSTQVEASVVSDVLSAGATAYAMKHVRPDDLASAIRQIFEHSIVFAPPSSVPAAPGLVVGSEGHGPAPAEPPRRDDRAALGAHLTRREREILTHVSEGMANAEIARQLWVSEQTVKFHLSNIYRKLNVTNRTQASRWARIGRVDEERSHHAVGS